LTTGTLQLADGTVDVWRGSLDQEPSVRARLESLLDRDESERARRCRFDRDRHRYVVGRGLLRTLLARYLGRDPEALRFRYGRERKPALVGEELRFNLAHAEGTVLYAFSSAFEVGVDVELLHDDVAGKGVAERFFSAQEAAALRALPERDRARAFLACWTRKEAFLKARGDGLTVPLDSFDVTVVPGEPVELLRTAWAPEERGRWQLVDLSEAARGEIAALAAPARGWTTTYRLINSATIGLNLSEGEWR
jgi:4'-phosphopantetheinyl transferase